MVRNDTSFIASIHAITGTKLMEFFIEKNTTKTLDLQQIKTGTYILQIEYNNNETEQNDTIRKTFIIK